MGDVVKVGIKQTILIGVLSATVVSDDAFGVLRLHLGFIGLLLVRSDLEQLFPWLRVPCEDFPDLFSTLCCIIIKRYVETLLRPMKCRRLGFMVRFVAPNE